MSASACEARAAHAVAHDLRFRAGDVLVRETSAPVWWYNTELERTVVIGRPTDEVRGLFAHAGAEVDGAVMRYPETNDLLPYRRPLIEPGMVGIELLASYPTDLERLTIAG